MTSNVVLLPDVIQPKLGEFFSQLLKGRVGMDPNVGRPIEVVFKPGQRDLPSHTPATNRFVPFHNTHRNTSAGKHRSTSKAIVATPGN